MTRTLGSLCLFLAAFDLPAIQLIERNGGKTVTREIVSLSIPDNGVVIIIADRIFTDSFQPSAQPATPALKPQESPSRGVSMIVGEVEPRGYGPRTDR